MDGVRKKAKYLHDAPDGALMPGVGGSYPHIDGTHPVPIPGQDAVAVSIPPQPGFYTQAPSATYYAQNPSQGQVAASTQDGPPIASFGNQQAPISPPYSQTHQGSIASTVSQGPPAQLQQFGGPLFDPSDPALFNFDISSLNFGNHYGALEMGMLGHMSSGAAETPPSDNNLMNPLNQAASMYQQHMSYGENPNLPTAMSFGPDGLPSSDWQNAHSRQGSLQVQTPNNTPTTATLDHSSNHRQDSLHGPHAYAIGQGPPSLSSASPASTDVNAGYDNDNPMSAAAFFANANQQKTHQRSPNVSRPQQENRLPGNVLQPIQFNAIRKRHRDTKWIYENITKGHDYVSAFHRLILFVSRRFSKASVQKVQADMGKYRPVLLSSASKLSPDDLIHQEQNLQLTLQNIEDFYSELGLPSLLCRRSGEVLWMNEEFRILTGWRREILLGQEPNMNVNFGPPRESRESSLTTQTGSTPIMAGQEPEPGVYPVSIVELMDERSAVEWLDDFSDLAYVNSRGTKSRRVNMLRYRTKEDMAKIEEMKASAANGKHVKQDPIKLEGGHVPRDMSGLALKDGLVDCMIKWYVKRDIFDMPMLVCMHVSIRVSTTTLYR